MGAIAARDVGARAAVVWIDGWHALIARTEDGRRTITEVDREVDSVHDYLLHVAHEAHDCDRLMIVGPDTTPMAFEREYETLYQRHNRLVDVEAAAAATSTDLIDRLRVLDGAGLPIG